MKRILRVAVSVVCAAWLAGCGGGGYSATSAPVQVAVRWGERTRALDGPGSALSMVLELKEALPGGDDLRLVANRRADPGGYEETYTSTQAASPGAYNMEARFYARNDGSGDLVGTARGVASLKADGTGIPTVATTGTITQVAITDETLVAGEAKDLTYSAWSSSPPYPGPLVVVTPGSVRYQVTSGGDALRVTNGRLEGVRAGIATVTATIDGVTSQPATVTVLSRPLVRVALRANELLYDPIAKRIYATVPGSEPGRGNTVSVIDPATGQVIRSIAVGSEPTRMAISDDGSMLYVALSGANKIAQVDLSSNTVKRTFVTNAPGINTALTVTEMAVVPGRPESVVVGSGDYYSPVGARLYVEGAAWGNFVEGVSGVFFRDSDQFVFAYPYGTTNSFAFEVLTLTDLGLFKNAGAQVYYEPVIRYPLRCIPVGNKIYTTWGKVIGSGMEGSFSLPQSGYGMSMAPDPARHRVYYVSQSDARLTAFDPRTFAKVGDWTLPLNSPYEDRMGSLVVCGEDILAYSANAEILIVKTDFWRQE